MNFQFGLIPLQAQPDGGSPFGAFVPIILITGIFYLLLIRPQQKKQKKLEAMIKAVDKGDNVVTTGGLHGKVIGVTDDVLTLDIGGVKGERIKVKVARARIEQVDAASKKGDES
jgi:preprotein translocase subunit YajC